MPAPDVRSAVVEMLLDSSVFHLRDRGLESAFLAGTIDIPLAELGMDSLAVMELCIAVEVRFGTTIVPSTLVELGSLDGLAARILQDHQ